jgi:hypothetical protein
VPRKRQDENDLKEKQPLLEKFVTANGDSD